MLQRAVECHHWALLTGTVFNTKTLLTYLLLVLASRSSISILELVYVDATSLLLASSILELVISQIIIVKC